MGFFEQIMAFANRYSSEAGLENGKPAQHTVSPCEHRLLEQLAAAAAQDESPVRYALHFTGDVQGVGFRWTNQSLAQERKLTGWVKNLDDGSVAMEIQGPPATIAAHLGRVHAYYQRFRNRIWLEQADPLPTAPAEDNFDVRMA